MSISPATPQAPSSKALLAVLSSTPARRRPIWMMRQAGRYLPEYRALREQAGSFLNLCYNPPLAAEVTLQPLQRFDLDAAILFADILLIPQALGVDLTFAEGEGPVLSTVTDAAGVAALKSDGAASRLSPVYETVERVAAAKADHVTLIGFCGAPWTVASYMIEGRGSNRQKARLAAIRGEDWFAHLMDIVTEASIDYLVAQLKAGAEAVQIFDSWAGDLPARQFERWSIQPIQRMVDGIRAAVPDARIIGFPKGVGSAALSFAKATNVDAVGVDSAVALDTMKDLSRHCAVQGNIDPLTLVAGGAALDEAVDDLVGALPQDRHIVNLGHGIVPETPIQHVAQFVDRVRRGDRS
ncbi:uroporphyrinogen decarboxylase [Rhodoligotrophos appendicifer]|uniref:uroporphyrinogen decarboxylase n=1 Tax=Rhodoligotrophos appendicifer TaxID=987056 RepID=UPI001181050E|nr:uroporphyrinogen decarboxylase [Rhodoligotrophos appendicifer]